MLLKDKSETARDNEQLRAVKDNCRNILMAALRKSDINLFHIIDPLISDNQCQMHSIFLLNILLKCYQYDECSFDVNRLEDGDIEILSEAVLLTYIKISQKDRFGIVLRQKSLEDFCGYLESKKQEKKFIAQIKESFNSKSVEFIKKIAKKSVKRILEDCTASIPHTKIKLKILPCYATVYAMMTYIKEKSLPILIVLKRIELHNFPSKNRYKINSVDLMYFKWISNKFQCSEVLNECEMSELCMTFDCYSLFDIDSSFINYKYEKYIEKATFPSKTFLKNCDICHLITASLATHCQLPESSDMKINEGYTCANDYVHSIYKKASMESTKQTFSVESRFNSNNTNVYEQYLAHCELAADFNCMNSIYTKIDGDIATRRTRNTFFGVYHAHVSNYFNECSKRLQESIGFEIDQFEILKNIDKTAVTLNALSKMGVIRTT